MKIAIALVSALLPCSASADKADDYIACTVGRYAVAIYNGRNAKQAAAYSNMRHCKEPKWRTSEAETVAEVIEMFTSAIHNSWHERQNRQKEELNETVHH